MSFDKLAASDKALILWQAEEVKIKDDLRSKDAIETRLMELYRTNDLMRGLVEKEVDTTIGSKVTVIPEPDALGLNIDPKEARKWAKIVGNEFANYADSPENWISADRSMNLTQMTRQSKRNRALTGDLFFSREWRASPLGYKTCFQLIGSKRVKNPVNQQKGNIVSGIELDRYGAAKRYYIEESELQDTEKSEFGTYGKTIKSYPKYNSFGWPQIFHVYEPFTSEYPRGISKYAVSIKKIKQIDRFIDADLMKAIIMTNYVFAITSDAEPDSIADMLAGVTGGSNSAMRLDNTNLTPEQQAKKSEILERILSERYLESDTGQVMHLFNGETMSVVAPPNTIQTSDNFITGHTKAIANGVGMSYEVGTGDFAGMSFSGGQLSLGIYEHSANVQREVYDYTLPRMAFRSWLDEAVSRGTIPDLIDRDGNVIDYWKNRDRYSKCTITGVKQIYLDPLKQAKANKISLSNGTTSRTQIANERGEDLESIVTTRANEAELISEAVKAVVEQTGGVMTAEESLALIIKLVTSD